MEELDHTVVLVLIFGGISTLVFMLLCCLVAQSWLTLCNPMDYSTLGCPVPYHSLEFAQVHVHYIHNALEPSHLKMPSSPSALNLAQHDGLFQ